MSSMDSTRDPWLAVSDGLVSGLAGALSGRAAALSTFAPWLEADRAAALAREAEHLSEIAGFLRLLTRGPEAPAETVQVTGLLAQVAAMQAHHRDLRDVRCVVFQALAAPQPVRVQPWALAHALLILLAAAARSARSMGLPEVLLGCGGDGASTVITVEPSTGRGAAPTGDQSADEPPAHHDVAAARALVAGAGGDVRSVGAGRYELRLPTLHEANLRERARATSGDEPGR